MTKATDRLKEIGKDTDFCECDIFHDPNIFADPDCNWHWLINRVKRLTEALEYISNRGGSWDKTDLLCLYDDVKKVARKSLEKSND